jgi:Putative quorum-sensing-regulated virulence factor
MKGDAMEMPFGKYVRQPVSTLPRRYLRWLVDNVALKGELKAEVQAALFGGSPSCTPQQDVDGIVKDIAEQLAELETEQADVNATPARNSLATEDKSA